MTREEDVDLAQKMRAKLDMVIKIGDNKTVENPFEVIEEMIYSLVNSDVHELQLSMRNFSITLADMAEEEQTKERKRMTSEALYMKLNQISSLMDEVREAKRVDKELRCGYQKNVGSILNAYREGDLIFTEAVPLLRIAGAGRIIDEEALREDMAEGVAEVLDDGDMAKYLPHITNDILDNMLAAIWSEEASMIHYIADEIIKKENDDK